MDQQVRQLYTSTAQYKYYEYKYHVYWALTITVNPMDQQVRQLYTSTSITCTEQVACVMCRPYSTLEIFW